MPQRREFRIASANLEHGGVSQAGDATRLGKTIEVLRRWSPDILLLQEVTAHTPDSTIPPLWGKPWDEQVRAVHDHAVRADAATVGHLGHVADALHMMPVLGPPMPMMFRRMHTAVLASPALEIARTGPPMPATGSLTPPWTEVIVRMPDVPNELAVYSLHLPPRTATLQRVMAEWLASIVAEHGKLTVIGGDWNSLARADDIGQSDLRAMKRVLRTARMEVSGGELRPSYAVEDLFTAIGMLDAAAHLPPGKRKPPVLSPTGSAGCRVDRFEVSRQLAGALYRYQQFDTGGSDHHAILLALDRGALAVAAPPGQHS